VGADFPSLFIFAWIIKENKYCFLLFRDFSAPILGGKSSQAFIFILTKLAPAYTFTLVQVCVQLNHVTYTEGPYTLSTTITYIELFE